MWACTCIRSCEISFCPSVESSCVSAYDVTPCTNVAPATAAMILGSRCILCPIITLLINGPDDTGSTKLHARFTTIRQKLPAISHFRGRIRAQTSGSTFFNGGLGRCAVISALAARPVPLLDRSPEGIPPPIPCDPNEADILTSVYLVRATRRKCRLQPASSHHAARAIS